MNTLISVIRPLELQSMWSNDHTFPVVDVRSPAEHAEVHIPGVRLHPLDRLDPADLLASGIRPDAPVCLVCRSGARATRAAEALVRAGFARPLVLEGGTQAWIDAGLPVTRGAGKVMSLERQVRVAAGALVVAGIGLGYALHPAFFGLSGLVGCGLVFAGLTDWCGMGLLLARAPWNQHV